MTQEQRQKVLDAILGPRDARINDRMWHELEQIHREDVLRIEPVIDQMMLESRELFAMFRGGSEFEIKR